MPAGHRWRRCSRTPRCSSCLRKPPSPPRQVEQVISKAPATAEQIERAAGARECDAGTGGRRSCSGQACRRADPAGAAVASARPVSPPEFGHGAAAAAAGPAVDHGGSSLTRSWRSFRPRRSSSTDLAEAFAGARGDRPGESSRSKRRRHSWRSWPPTCGPRPSRPSRRSARVPAGSCTCLAPGCRCRCKYRRRLAVVRACAAGRHQAAGRPGAAAQSTWPPWRWPLHRSCCCSASISLT